MSHRSGLVRLPRKTAQTHICMKSKVVPLRAKEFLRKTPTPAAKMEHRKKMRSRRKRTKRKQRNMSSDAELAAFR